MHGMHEMHSDFSAPPYGQPNVAPDAPSAPGTVGPPQPTPEMMLQQHLADVRQTHTAADANEATVLQKLAAAHAALNPVRQTPGAAAVEHATALQRLAQAKATLHPPAPRTSK